MNMGMETLPTILLWCAGINYAILFLWFGVFVLAHEWLYRLHTRWFSLSVEMFDTIHYTGMAVYKIGVLFFIVVPLVATYIAVPGH